MSILFVSSSLAELSLLLVLSVEWPRRLFGARCSALASVALSSRLGRDYLCPISPLPASSLRPLLLESREMM